MQILATKADCREVKKTTITSRTLLDKNWGPSFHPNILKFSLDQLGWHHLGRDHWDLFRGEKSCSGTMAMARGFGPGQLLARPRSFGLILRPLLGVVYKKSHLSIRLFKVFLVVACCLLLVACCLLLVACWLLVVGCLLLLLLFFFFFFLNFQ